MTETERQLHSVCFTGHRPEKLNRREDEIKADLEKEIRQTIADGWNVFLSGMARGVDIWAAQIVLKLRDEGERVQLVCASPYDGVEKGWKSEWREAYQRILARADRVEYICERYQRGCFQRRNEWMVNASSMVIAVFNGEKGGTKNTVDYAVGRNISVVYISA